MRAAELEYLPVDHLQSVEGKRPLGHLGGDFVEAGEERPRVACASGFSR